MLSELDVRRVSKEIVNADGNVSSAARRLGIARGTLHRYVRENREIAEVLEDVREAALDDAEDALMKAVRAGEAWAICFYLKTRGKSRGYTERLEVAPVARTVVEIEYIDGPGWEMESPELPPHIAKELEE